MGTIEDSRVEYNLVLGKKGKPIYCRDCSIEFVTRSKFLKHFKDVHNRLRKFKCCYCDIIMAQRTSLKRHLSRLHEIDTKTMKESSHIVEVAVVAANIKDPKTKTNNEIKCLECNISFAAVKQLRSHLSAEHNMDMSEQTLVFPNMDAFKKWKREIERKELSYFVMHTGQPFEKFSKGMKHIYYCNRSGNKPTSTSGQTPRQRVMKRNTNRQGVVCTAKLMAYERDSEVTVSYFPHHYGHGKSTHLLKWTEDIRTAVDENVSNGVPLENLADDLWGPDLSEDFNVALMKKSETRYLMKALNADEFHPGMDVMESIEKWVRSCCQIEDTPILYYNKSDSFASEETFLLIIMTEFQKQILLTSQRQIVCLDVHKRIKGGCIFMCVLNVIDEYDVAFPVAFCFSNRLNGAVVTQFLSSVKESAGCISCDYFMSNEEKFYHDAWCVVMGDKPKWLWNPWCVRRRYYRKLLIVYRNDASVRTEAYNSMRKLMGCQSEQMFQTLLKNFIAGLKSRPESFKLTTFMDDHLAPNVEMWAHCHRKDVDAGTTTTLEASHSTFRFLCRSATDKRLDTFIFVAMKLVRYKMLDRLMRVNDAEMIRLANEAIVSCHETGLDIPSECVSSLSDKIWLIRSPGQEVDVYITREYESCPELCDLRCTKCDICVHMYSCSCTQSLIYANLCPHIHAVVWKFLTPHFSPPPSPAMSVGDEDTMSACEGSDTEVSEGLHKSAVNKNSGELLKDIMKQMQNIYELITTNKCKLSRENMLNILKKQQELVDICSGKPVPEGEPKKPEVPLDEGPVLNSGVSPIVTNQVQFLPFSNYATPTAQFTFPFSNYYYLVPNLPSGSSV